MYIVLLYVDNLLCKQSLIDILIGCLFICYDTFSLCLNYNQRINVIMHLLKIVSTLQSKHSYYFIHYTMKFYCHIYTNIYNLYVIIIIMYFIIIFYKLDQSGTDPFSE